MGAVMFQSFARLHALWLMFLVFAVAWSFPATKGLAQAVAAVSPEAQSVPEIVVTATRPVKPRHKRTGQGQPTDDTNGGVHGQQRRGRQQ